MEVNKINNIYCISHSKKTKSSVINKILHICKIYLEIKSIEEDLKTVFLKLSNNLNAPIEDINIYIDVLKSYKISNVINFYNYGEVINYKDILIIKPYEINEIYIIINGYLIVDNYIDY